MKTIKIAIVGVGNCAASLIMGLEYYKNISPDDDLIPGIMHNSIGGYLINDIKPVAAFDVDKRKIGTDLSTAIFSKPNCTKIFSTPEPFGVDVMKGPVLDGVAPHMKDYFQVDEKQEPVDVASVLKKTKTDILINYLPVGSDNAAKFYAQQALEANCAFINCIPVFIASNKEWTEKFQKAGLPIIGDDIKSEIGATITNRVLVQMIQDRGGKIINSWQTNFGGNCDFLNMTSQDRLYSKKISKTESISSLIPNDYNTKPYIYAGPNGSIECLNDKKISFMRIDFKIFGDIECSIDIKLDVEDSPNSAGIVVDAIRCVKLALDKGISGPIIPACAYFCKRPPIQMKDEDSRKQLEDFITYERCPRPS